MLPKEERAALLTKREVLMTNHDVRKALEFLSHYLLNPYPEYLTGAQKLLEKVIRKVNNENS